MSAVPTELSLGEPPTEPEPSEPSSLPPRAKVFLYAIGTLAAAAAVVPFAHLSLDTDGWLAFLVLATSAALAQLFVVTTPRDQSYHTTMVVLVPGGSPAAGAGRLLLVVVQHVPEWLKVRYPWYIQAFNASNYLVDLFAARRGRGRPAS